MEVHAGVNEDVSISVVDLLDGGDLGVVEDIVLVVSEANGPVVSCVHGPIVHNHSHQPIIVFAKNLELVIQDRVTILDLFAFMIFKPI